MNNPKFHTILSDQKFIFEGREIDLDVSATKVKNHRKLQPKIPVLVLIDTVGRNYPMEDCLTVTEFNQQNETKAMMSDTPEPGYQFQSSDVVKPEPKKSTKSKVVAPTKPKPAVKKPVVKKKK